MRRAAAIIAEGKILGWFQGRAEWGPRALGNRSIVADPRRPEMKEILNRRIKHRESFRPFAPSILAEATGEYFAKSHPSPFMTLAYPVRPEKREKIPAPTHVDGTGRLQTVTHEANSRYHALISAFRDLTGVPVVLNTSFNDNEPIVCSPEQAIDCFERTQMAHTVVDTISIHHRITVLCGRPSYDPTERHPWRPYQTENVDLVRIIRAGSTEFPRFNMKNRLMNYLSYVMLALPRALFLNCDVVLAMTDPPFQGIVGAFLAMLKRKPYVYNIRDLYPDMAVGGNIVPPGALTRIWERLNRWALGRA